MILDIPNIPNVETNHDFINKIILAAIGALIGGLISKYLNRNREKVLLTFEMHRELNSYEMSIHRRKADNLIKLFPLTLYSELAHKNDTDSISVFVLLRFFQRLSQSIKYNQIKKKLVPDLFVDTFYFWYYISYEKNVIPL